MTITEAIDALPDRDLTMDEAERVGLKFGAQGMNRVSYTDDDDGERKVWMMNLLIDGVFLMVTRHDGEGWSGEVIAEGLRDNEFHDALDHTMQKFFGVSVDPGETIKYEDGEVIERWGGEESGDQDA